MCHVGGCLVTLGFLHVILCSVAFTLDIVAEEESQGLRKTSESRVEQLLVRWTLIVDFTNTVSVLLLFSI